LLITCLLACSLAWRAPQPVQDRLFIQTLLAQMASNLHNMAQMPLPLDAADPQHQYVVSFSGEQPAIVRLPYLMPSSTSSPLASWTASRCEATYRTIAALLDADRAKLARESACSVSPYGRLLPRLHRYSWVGMAGRVQVNEWLAGWLPRWLWMCPARVGKECERLLNTGWLAGSGYALLESGKSDRKEWLNV